jgi:hypothetical protein
MSVRALEKVFPGVAARDRIEGFVDAAPHPAVGTLVIVPDLGLKIEASLRRRARQIALRLCFQQALLRLVIFALQMSLVPLKLRCDLARFLYQLTLE